MKLTPNESILRIALIIFSIIFGMLSVSLIALGVVYIDELWWPRRYVGLDFLELPTIIILLGAVSLIMAIFGCCCSKSYNRRVLLSFAATLILILCLELTIAVIAFINYDEHKEGKGRTHQIMLDQLNSVNEEDHIIFKQMEEHYNCCGVTGLEDACNTTDGQPTTANRGCASVVDTEIQTIAMEAGYFAVVLAVLQAAEIGYVYLIQHLVGILNDYN